MLVDLDSASDLTLAMISTNRVAIVFNVGGGRDLPALLDAIES